MAESRWQGGETVSNFPVVKMFLNRVFTSFENHHKLSTDVEAGYAHKHTECSVTGDPYKILHQQKGASWPFIRDSLSFFKKKLASIAS